ncbi:unnamed protein product [Closterium sp. Naga37s-1]|nr:unnamed protein product [Closterium sp. Naga37s-1]
MPSDVPCLKTGAQVYEARKEVGGGENYHHLSFPNGLNARPILVFCPMTFVQVYEARKEVGGGEGTIISLFPNGLRALSRIDPAILIPLGVTDPASVLLSPGGEIIAPWGYSATMTARFGLPMLFPIQQHVSSSSPPPSRLQLIPLGVTDPASFLLSPAGEIIAPWGHYHHDLPLRPSNALHPLAGRAARHATPSYSLPFSLPATTSLCFISPSPHPFLHSLLQLIPLGVTDPASFLLSPADPASFLLLPAGEVTAPWGYSATMTARFGLPMLFIRWRDVLDVLRLFRCLESHSLARRAERVTDPASFLLSPAGEVIAPWGYSATMTARFGLPMLSIRWRDVLDVLRGMLPNDAVHTGHRLVKTPLLLGADGIHSEARKQLLGGTAGEGVGPRDNGRTIWRAIIDSSLCPHPLLKPRHILAMVGPGRTATISDAAAGRLYWAFTLVDSADPTVSSARSSGGEEARGKILRAFEGWDVVTQLALATPPDLILERRVLDLPSLPFWVKGRTALLGDAAHAVTPPLGQGANLAFEDAAQLVECLRAHSLVSDVLQSFQSIRMPRVQAVVSQNVASSKKIYEDKEEEGTERDSSKGTEAAAGATAAGKGGGEESEFYDYLYSYDTLPLEGSN